MAGEEVELCDDQGLTADMLLPGGVLFPGGGIEAAASA